MSGRRAKALRREALLLNEGDRKSQIALIEVKPKVRPWTFDGLDGNGLPKIYWFPETMVRMVCLGFRRVYQNLKRGPDYTLDLRGLGKVLTIRDI